MEDAIDPLAIPLRDPHLPAAVGWWPPAPGWWILLGLLLVAAIMAALVFRHRRRTAARRLALRALDGVAEQYASHGDASRLVRDLAALLKRTVIRYSGNRAAAASFGAAWHEHLAELAQDDRARAQLDALRELVVADAYRPHPTADADTSIAACRAFISHLPPRDPGDPGDRAAA